MKESKLAYLLDPLREMLYQFDVILKGYRARSGSRLAAVTCDMFPADITSSMGLVPVRVPFLADGCCPCRGIPAIEKIEELYDCLVVPQTCAGKGAIAGRRLPVHEFNVPAGWGAESSEKMKASLDGLLQKAGYAGLGDLNAGRLRSTTLEYNVMRRLVRGIASVRGEKPDILSCRDLALVFEAASVFPPECIIEHLAAVLENLNASESGRGGGGVRSIVYAGVLRDPLVLDEIEEAGCLIVEDDMCGGRRLFEMSYNHEAPDLPGEILDAFSYRPRCPAVRTVEERIELFYAMMKGHGIELVLFMEDFCCPPRKRDIEALRIRLMRSGVDPVVVNSGNALEKIRPYLGGK